MPKMSKAEKEAEAERLRLEAEAAAEKAAKELAEMEAQRDKEAKERLVNEEALMGNIEYTFNDETTKSEGLYAERAHELDSEMTALNVDKEWKLFLACEELPDVLSEGDVNTYLTTWSEAPTGTLWQALPGCSQAITLVRSLLLSSAYAYSRGGVALKQHAWQMGLQKGLLACLNAKLDGATAEFLQRSDEFYNKETQSCVAMLPAEGCRYGLWVNLAKNPRMKMIELPELSITIELPKALALASIAVRVTQYDDDVVSHYASAASIANAKLMALGGILKVDLAQLPQAPKKVKGYTLRAVNEMSHSVVPSEYPIRGLDGSIPVAAPPLRISYALPDSVLLAEGYALKIGWWDSDVQPVGEDGATEDRGSWKTEGISDVQYDADTKIVSFDTLHLTSLSLLQPTHLELPYKRWLFAPLGPSAGELHVVTQRFTLHFAITSKGVVLKAPLIPQTAAMVNVAPMTAPVLLLRLRACGINLCPKDSDAETLERITPKSLELEESISSMLCPLLPRYYLTASRWNQTRGPNKVTLRMAVRTGMDGLEAGMTGYDAEAGAAEAAPPASDPFEAVESDWPTMLLMFRRVIVVNTTDDSLQFDECAKEGVIAHSTPIECLKGEDPEVVDVLRNSSVLYQDTVRQLLNSLRLFSFTAE